MCLEAQQLCICNDFHDGYQTDNNSKMNYRNTSIVGLAIALGMGVTQANAALAQLPAWVTTIFG